VTEELVVEVIVNCVWYLDAVGKAEARESVTFDVYAAYIAAAWLRSMKLAS
jgi:hypothetical protein